MEDKEKLEDIYNEIQRRKESESQDFLGKIPRKTRFMLGIAIAIIIGYMYVKKIDMTNAIYAICAVILIIYFATMGEGKGEECLTIRESVAALLEHIEYYQNTPYRGSYMLPRGKIITRLVGKLRYLNGKPWKREIGFDIIPTGKTLPERYSADVNVYGPNRGDIIGIYSRPGGFDGLSPDIQTIYKPSRDLMNERRADDYGYKRR